MILACFLLGAKTMAGLRGECFMMAWYTGLAMVTSRVPAWLTLYPVQETKGGRGRGGE